MNVSAICPVFNTRADELRAAVASVLDQAGGVHELILIDDASTAPATLEALEAAACDARVTVLRAARNGGPAAARNLGLAQASGEWVGFIDADDLWPDGKLARARAFLAERPDSRWIVGDFAYLWADGPDDPRPALPCFASGDATGPSQCTPVLTRQILLDGVSLGCCLIHRTLLRDRRFDPAVQYGEDLLFLIKLSLVACADRAPGPSYMARRQGQSMMWSARRLGSHFAGGVRAGLRDPELRAFRGEYREALYLVYKDLAANNHVNGQRFAGLGYALRAWWLAPREVRDVARFLWLQTRRDKADLVRYAKWYSKREVIDLAR